MPAPAEDAPLVQVEANPAPGPGGRITRTAGQGGATLTLVQLWQAFGWFGADKWTAEQAGVRWPAVTAALFLAFAIGQNIFNWWRSERSTPVGAVTVEGVAPADKPPKLRAR